MGLLLLVILYVAVPGIMAQYNLEKAYKICQDIPRQDLEPCLINLVNSMQPLFEEGAPEIDLEPLDSLPVGELTIQEGTGNTFLKGRFRDLKIKGLHEFKLTQLKINYDERTVNASVIIPGAFITGRYELEAMLLFVPLNGNGTFWFRLENIVGSGGTDLSISHYDGEPHLDIGDIFLDFELGNVTARLNNLYQKNPILKETANAFVNDNAKLIVEELKPTLVKKILVEGEVRTKRVFKKIKLENLAGAEYMFINSNDTINNA